MVMYVMTFLYHWITQHVLESALTFYLTPPR